MSETSPTVHALKTAPPYYDAVLDGMKTFDIRTFDRPFKVGDSLVLCEYVEGRYTGNATQRVITYVMDDPEYVLPGNVVLGIRPVTLGEVIELTPWTGDPLCVFCKILYGEAPGKIVREWDDAIALVPLSPVCGGHVLIIPKLHVARADTDPQVTGATAARAAEYAAMYDSYNIVNSAGRAATQSIDHLHIHVVPRAVDDKLMLPWGTIHGDDPTAPHWCRVAQELQESLTELRQTAP
jgi:histidine triad (HIT) family protein